MHSFAFGSLCIRTPLKINFCESHFKGTKFRQTVLSLCPTAMAYENFSWKEDCKATSNRSGGVILSRLLLRYTSLLKAFAHPAANPQTRCALKSRKQWNIGSEGARISMSSDSVPSPKLGVSLTGPEKVLALARTTSRAQGGQLDNKS